MTEYNKYIDNFGRSFDLVGNISFDANTNFCLLGDLVIETTQKSFDPFVESKESYIFQSKKNPNIGYKLYKDYKTLKYNKYNDNVLLQKLLSRNYDIKMTNFPKKVLTINNIVIGQEIPFYPNSLTLKEYFEEYKDIDALLIYQKVLLILKELFDNGIVYLDTHYKNFMINPLTGKVNVIDFDSDFILFDKKTIEYQKQVLYLYINMINKLSKNYCPDDKEQEFNISDDFQNLFEQINLKRKKLINEGRSYE